MIFNTYNMVDLKDPSITLKEYQELITEKVTKEMTETFEEMEENKFKEEVMAFQSKRLERSKTF